MSLSPYIAKLRAQIGPARLVLPSVSAHLFDDGGRLLLVRERDSGVWSTPGGFIEPDERPADAARREVWEEAGLLVRPQRIVGVYGGPECVVRYANGDEVQYTIIAFGCDIEEGAPRPAGDETIATRFCSAAEASSLPLAPWLRAMLPMVFASRMGFHHATWEPPEIGGAGGSRASR